MPQKTQNSHQTTAQQSCTLSINKKKCIKITTVSVCIISKIFPLLILPQLPKTLTLAFLTLFACVLAFIPVKTVRYIALTLLFFV